MNDGGNSKEVVSFESARFGHLECDADELIWIEQGLLGFPISRRYVLFPHGEGGKSPFFWLQSVDESEVAFLVINPFEFFPGLEIGIDEEEAKALELDSLEDVEIFTLVTIPEGRPLDARTNLAGPVVVNTANRKGRQIMARGLPHRQLLNRPVGQANPARGDRRRRG